MIIFPNIIKNKLNNFFENEFYKFYWSGVIFIDDTVYGIESLKKLSKLIQTESIVKAISHLKGIFFLHIISKEDDVSYSMIDNNGIYRAYYSENIISTSFLDLIAELKVSSQEINKESLVEFLHLGFNSKENTLINSIKCFKGETLIITKNKQFQYYKKEIKRINEPLEDFSTMEYLSKMAKTFRGKKLGIDLTGGIDSRLLVTIFDYYNLDYELYISGMKGNKDIEIAQTIANILHKKLNITYHEVDNIEEQLSDLIDRCDGVCDIIANHRLYLHNLSKRRNGIDITISGAGGELYKDFWWLQDFPFYNRRKANINKLYNYRIAPIKHQVHFLKNGYFEKSMQLKKNTILYLNTFRIGTNTNTYDNIYYNYKMKYASSNFIKTNNSLVDCYAPLLEMDFVRYGYHLPNKTRFFNFFHRNLISNLNINLAKVQTTESKMSVSNESNYILRDIIRFSINRIKRVSKKIIQKVLSKTVFHESPNNPQIYSKIRQIIDESGTLNILKTHGIIKENISIDDINNNYLGKLIVIADIYRRLS